MYERTTQQTMTTMDTERDMTKGVPVQFVVMNILEQLLPLAPKSWIPSIPPRSHR